MENFNANFHKVSNVHNVEIMVLGGQAVQVIKKVKKEDEIQLTTSESEFVNAVNSEEDLQTVPEKSE